MLVRYRLLRRIEADPLREARTVFAEKAGPRTTQ
jgi:hypothetical protein